MERRNGRPFVTNLQQCQIKEKKSGRGKKKQGVKCDG